MSKYGIQVQLLAEYLGKVGRQLDMYDTSNWRYPLAVLCESSGQLHTYNC